MLDGNDAQNRMIIQQVAQQAVDLYKREQEHSRTPLSAQTIFSVISFLMALTTLGWQVGVTSQRIDENVRRIQAIEAFGFDKNFARLEAKVDLLVDERNRKLDQ